MSPEELAAIRERALTLHTALRTGTLLPRLDQSVADLSTLLAEVERLNNELDTANRVILLGEDQMGRDKARLGKVRALAERWRYKGEFGWGAWQEGYGPDPEGAALDHAATELLQALDGSDQ